MPAYPVRVSFQSHNNATGALIVNVFNYEVDWLIDPIDYGKVAKDVHDQFAGPYVSLLSSLDTWDQVVARQWEVPGVAPGEGSFPVATLGARAVAQQDLAPACCALISLKTATPKRYARGHVFAPPAYTTAVTAPPSRWNPTGPYFTKVVDVASAYQLGFSTGNAAYKPIVFSYTRLKLKEPPYQFDVVSAAAKNEQHWLRKRLTTP